MNEYLLKILLFVIFIDLCFIYILRFINNKYHRIYTYVLIIYVAALGLSMFTRYLPLINILHHCLFFIPGLSVFVNNEYIKGVILVFLIILLMTWHFGKDYSCLIDLYVETENLQPKRSQNIIYRIGAYLGVVIFLFQIFYILYKKQNKFKSKKKSINLIHG